MTGDLNIAKGDKLVHTIFSLPSSLFKGSYMHLQMLVIVLETTKMLRHNIADTIEKQFSIHLGHQRYT